MRPTGRPKSGEGITDEEKVQWVALYNSGLSSLEIADQVGVSKATIQKHMRSLGISRSTGRKKIHVGMEKSEVVRMWWIKRAYGLTLAEYDALVVEQNGVCAICGQPPTGTGRSGACLNVDHSHVTGKRRSLLCSRCNICIGQMGDDPELLEKAAAYLRHHASR